MSLGQAIDAQQALSGESANRYLDQLAMNVRAELNGAKSARGFIEQMIRALGGAAAGPEAERSCRFWNTAIEFGQRNPQAARLVTNGVERFSSVFTGAVRRAQQEGEIPADKDPQVLGTYLLTSMNGLWAMLRGGVERRRAGEITQLILRALD